jgi:voltage-gated potassium channel Kch
MLSNFIYGISLIILTSVIHTITTKTVFDIINKKAKVNTPLRRVIHVDIIVLMIILASLIEASIWAISYLHLSAMNTFEEALYFSLVTFTTLGYGDIVLGEEFRLLGAFEAANGVIIFGWSTAIVVSTLQKLYAKSNH